MLYSKYDLLCTAHLLYIISFLIGVTDMAKDYSQVNFRIPTKLKEQIEQSAVTNERSLTAEIVARLEQSFTEQPTIDLTGLQEEIRQLRTEAREMRMLYVEAIAAKGLNK